MAAYTQVARYCASEAKRVLLRSHSNNLLSTYRLRKYLDGEFHRIAHNNVSGVRQVLGTQVGLVLKKRQICATHLTAIDTAWRQRQPGCHNYEVGVRRRYVWKHFDQNTMIIEGIHQIHSNGKKPSSGIRLPVAHELNTIKRLQQVGPKYVRAQCASNSARCAEDCNC
jgi:hypothetical protein